MDLCLAFGEPDPERFMESVSDQLLDDWMEYLVIRGLPAHLPRMFATFQANFMASKGVKSNRDDFMLLRKPVPKADLRQRIKQNFSAIGNAIKARGTS